MAILAAIAAPGEAQEGTLEGAYVLAPERSQDIAAAIDKGIARMSFVARPIARSRLKKTNAAYQRVRIARDSGHVEIQFDDRKPVRMPLDGTSVRWTREDGEAFDVSASWKPAELVQTYKAPDGQRTNTFRSTDGGSTLTLDVAISSEKLPEPVRYTLAYRRAGPGSDAR